MNTTKIYYLSTCYDSIVIPAFETMDVGSLERQVNILLEQTREQLQQERSQLYHDLRTIEKESLVSA